MGMMAPQSPEVNRKETAWEYSQSAPFVFKGDLHYYFVEHDLTNTAKDIDTSRVAVYLMARESNPFPQPSEARVLAGKIKGSKFTELKGLGHFGMWKTTRCLKNM